MCAKLYISDNENHITNRDCKTEIPLACNLIYYVESIENKPMNDAMRQMADQKRTLFDNPNLQPFPFRLQYVAQSDFNEEALRSVLFPDCDKELAEETINAVRCCFSDSEGGLLVARCIPRFSYDGTFEDKHTLCTFPGLRFISPQSAANKAAWFARKVAEQNFYHLSGELYEDYLETSTSGRGSVSPYGGMGFIQRKKTKSEIEKNWQQNSEALSEWLIENNIPDEEAICILDIVKKQLKNKGKRTELCPMVVSGRDIQLVFSDKECRKLSFKRGDVAKMLYIFFLIQIKRAKKNPSEPKYIAQANLVDYKEDLFNIYRYLCCNRNVDTSSVESLWDWRDKNNNYGNALTSIRTVFREIFDLEGLKSKTNKCYTIEIMGKDKFNGNQYGIMLDAKDFKLEYPFNDYV